MYVAVLFFFKSTIYYTGRSGSPCLLGVGCESTTLTAGGQSITNVAGGIYHCAIPPPWQYITWQYAQVCSINKRLPYWFSSIMSTQILDVPAKHSFSISALLDTTWNSLTGIAFQREWSPLTKLAKAAVLLSVVLLIILAGS